MSNNYLKIHFKKYQAHLKWTLEVDMSKIKTLFGKRLKEYRKHANLTQAQLAESVGVDDKHISCIEAGKNFPSADLIERLAKSLNIEPKNLFEYYHLQDEVDLKKEIVLMAQKLSIQELTLTYKYMRNFLIE